MPILIISDECYYGEHENCDGLDEPCEQLCECSCHDQGDDVELKEKV